MKTEDTKRKQLSEWQCHGCGQVNWTSREESRPDYELRVLREIASFAWERVKDTPKLIQPSKSDQTLYEMLRVWRGEANKAYFGGRQSMRHPEPVTIAPKYRVGQVVKFWKASEYGGKDFIWYAPIRRVEAKVEWKDGSPEVAISYDLVGQNYWVREPRVVEVVTEETCEISQEGDK